MKFQSAYAQIAKYMSSYLINDHDLALFTPVGNTGSMDYVVTNKFMPDGSEKQVEIPIYPGNSFDYGEDICSYHYDDWKADILLLMVDIFALKDPNVNPPGILGHSRKGHFKTVLIAPVDYLSPFPPGLADYFNSCYRIVPWCYDAYNKLQQAGVKNILDPIPCGLDTKLWSPLDRTKFPETMSTMGFSEKNYNILMVGANQGTYRKAWAESFNGISLFKKAHPEANIKIYLHSPTVGGGSDWNFQELSRFYGLIDNITTMDTYQFSLGKFTEEMLVRMYACCDVVINAGAEGFGYSTLQAQAMGKPVVGLNACVLDSTNISSPKIEKTWSRPYTGQLITIETETGLQLALTPNHPLLTETGWVRADNIYTSDRIYCDARNNSMDTRRIGDIATGISSQDSSSYFKNDSAFTQKHNVESLFTGLEENNAGTFDISKDIAHGYGNILFGWNSGWRRNDNVYASTQKESQAETHAVHNGLKHITGTNELVGYETPNSECISPTLLSERLCPDTQSARYYSRLSSLETSRAISNNQEGTGEASAIIHRRQTHLQPARPQFRLSTLAPSLCKMVKLETVEKVVSSYAEGIRVYNLTTLGGYYFANGLLVHNCATPELVRYGVLVEPQFQLQTPSLLIAPFPAPKDIAEGLEILFLNQQDKFEDQRADTIQWVKETFDWGVIMAKWKNVLEGIEGDLRRECQLRSEFPPRPADWSLERMKKEVRLK